MAPLLTLLSALGGGLGNVAVASATAMSSSCTSVGAAPAGGAACGTEAGDATDEHGLLALLQHRAGQVSSLTRCMVGQDLLCPGNAAEHCSGNTCCSDVDGLGSFVCPSAAAGFNECDRPKPYDCTTGGVPPASPPEPVTYHPHFDTTPDYLGIAHTAKGIRGNPGKVSDNYYLVIGDWGGARYGCDTCGARQRQVAAKMHEFVQNKAKFGGQLLFVLSVGDNFYWQGANASKFKAQWEDIYSEELRSVPWFSVMGNHDYGEDDPGSVCPQIEPRFVCHPNARSDACGGRRPYSTKEQGYDSNALNTDKGGVGGPGRKSYHMPDYTYFYTIPELDFELLAMDYNWLAAFPNALGGNGITEGAGAAKNLEHCKNNSELMSGSLRGIQQASTRILYERAAAAESRNIAIIGHYPAAFQAEVNFRSMFLRALPHHVRREPDVLNFYGHTHIQRCYCERQPGAEFDSCIGFLAEDQPTLNNATCVDFMTGGGGGCCSAEDVPGGFVSISFTGCKLKGIRQIVDCFVGPDCTVDPYATAVPRGAANPSRETCPFTNDDQRCRNAGNPFPGPNDGGF